MVFLLTHRLVEGFVFLLLLRVHILSAMLPLGAHFCQPLEARISHSIPPKVDNIF